MKIYAVTLGFAPSRILLTTFDQVYKTIGIPVQHLLLNNHYPVDEERNDELVRAICQAYGVKYYDLGENVGLAAGYNYLLRDVIPYDPESIVIGIDPDTWPITKGWGAALADVHSDPKIGWATLQNQASERELKERGFTARSVKDVPIYSAHQACVNSICAWKLSMLKELNWLSEPKKYYGGIEGHMFHMVKKMGLDWVYLPTFKEESSALVSSEELYRTYKWNYAHLNNTQLSFKEWLKLQ